MILVTGGGGTLGAYLLKELKESKVDFECLTRSDLDLLSTDAIKGFFVGKRYSIIIHLAAETDVDLCERDPKRAFLINSLATEKIAECARDMGAFMIFISTSAVFGGVVKLRYSELDFPMPLNLYGNSKFLGEQAVRRLCESHLIIRSSWMVGGGPKRDTKFISKILPKLQSNELLLAVHDKHGSLTYAKTLATFIVRACHNRLTGTMHFASNDYCSRFDIAKFIAERIGSKSIITGVDSNLFPLSAPRSASETLYSLRSESPAAATWKDIIMDYLKEWL